MIAGAGAGLVSSIVTCPLDVVKTKLQAQGVTPAAGTTSRNVEGVMGESFYTRTTYLYSIISANTLFACIALSLYHVGTVRQIWYTEGIRGLYRGLAPTIYGYLPTWAIYFTVSLLLSRAAMLSFSRGYTKTLS